MRVRCQFAFVLALMFGMAFFVPSHADATSVMPPNVPSTVTANGTTAAQCSQYPGVTNRIAGCMRQTIANVTQTFFDPQKGFYPMVAKIIATFMTLGVAIYGVMLAGGMVERVGRDTLMLITKIALVGFFTQNTPMMYNYILYAMDTTAATVVQVTPQNGTADGTNDFGKIKCLQDMKSASDKVGKPIVGPWVAMDCLIDTVIGIHIPTDSSVTLAPGQGGKAFNEALAGRGLQRGLIFFFFSGIKTSVFGLMLGIIGFVFMWGLVAMIIKSLMTYIAGYIGVTFMVIISPLIIPLVLFRHTKEYFDKWVKLVLSFALQPILILLFVSLSITAVDLALSSGQYSVMYRIAGDASRTSNFNLNTYLESAGAVSQKPLTFFFDKTDPKPVETTNSDSRSIIDIARSKECLDSVIAGKGCPNSIPVQMYRDTIDWPKLAAKRSPPVVLEDDAKDTGQQISREIMTACIFLGIVVFVMNRLMTVVPHILVDLIGDFGQTPNLNAEMTKQWNNTAPQMAAGMEGTISKSIDGLVNKLRGAP